MPTKTEATDCISNALEEIPKLMSLNINSSEFVKWRRTTEIDITKTFEGESRNISDFKNIRFAPMGLVVGGPSVLARRDAYRNGLEQAKGVLESMLDEIERHWPDNPAQSISDSTGMSEQQVSNRVFVVHGRDGGTRDTVARFLESLELESVILLEQPSEGRTIIEKFEDYSDVGYAVVLCTPDDVGALASEQDKLRPRPRQNVVLELGFFLGSLGRNRVCALLDGEMEMPSDYGGVLFVPLDGGEGWKLTLAREMRAASMDIDLNRIA